MSKYFTYATPANFQITYNTFVSAYPEPAKIISSLRPNGVGPGEMVISFLFNNITIGGANAPCDLLLDGAPWGEVKGGRYCKSYHSMDDFKLSRDQDPSVKYIVNALTEDVLFKIKLDGYVYNQTGEKVCHYTSPFFQQQVEKNIEAKTQSPVDRDSIVEKWKDMIFYEYVEGKPFALVQTNTLKMRYFGYLTKPMVDHYRNHRNQPWARVFLPRE